MSVRRSSRRVLLGALWSVMLASACSSSSPETVRATASATSETVIEGPNDVVVRVPAGALAEDTVIVVQALPPSRRPGGNAIPVADGVRLGPKGQEFALPVEILMPVPIASLPPGKTIDDVVIMRAPQNGDAFVPLPTRRRGGEAVAAVTEHFSDFVAVLRDAPDGSFDPCGDTMCVGGETCDLCPTDCGLCLPANTCGNRLCESTETCTSCDFDCPFCGPTRGSITFGATGLEWLVDAEPGTFVFDDAVAHCAALDVNGQTDWRVPTRDELVRLVDYDAGDPAFDVTFPTTPGDQFWSSRVQFDDPTFAYIVRSWGGFSPLDRTMTAKLRCVRTESTVTARSFNDNADGTVTDSITGLLWQQADDAMGRDAATAATYCAGLVLGPHASGWRLPTMNELATIVDDARLPPTINAAFAATGAGAWSSTVTFSSPVHNYTVDFLQGYVVITSTGASQRTRCVHDP